MKPLLFCIAVLCFSVCDAQLVISNPQTAQALVQRLIGDGVTVSNVSFTGNSSMAGFFHNLGQTNINIDSGIVLTSGVAKSRAGFSTDTVGLNGDALTAAEDNLANNSWDLPGDADLANAVGSSVSDMHDACVLEFDFVPSGDSIKFNYVFSSEEYTPAFACSDYIDAFAFFISGPGITGSRNIALVPGTNLPVSILNINNVIEDGIALCPSNISYYVDNSSNTYFTHDGHTRVLTAFSQVQPCNVYHLKLVISDNFDDQYDSGVFLEAKSLTSNIVSLVNNTQTDPLNNSYIVEGCLNGSFRIKRPYVSAVPLTIRLAYSGTAQNTIDVQTLPATVTIPANDSMVTVNVIPVIDNIPEGIEFIKVYAVAACGSALPIDSTIIQIRDYDTLGLSVDTARICRDGSIQLVAYNGYNSYQWTAVPGLSSYTSYNPIATPVADSTTYICTAQLGSCHARDSAFIIRKRLALNSQRNVNCRNAATGQVIVAGGNEWASPVQYFIDNSAGQATGIFNNLPVGTYHIKIKDAANCVDSVIVDIIQAFPDLIITDTIVENASCLGIPDGIAAISVSGGKPAYQYSLNGGPFQNNAAFNVTAGSYNITVKDNNGCTNGSTGIVVPMINTVSLTTDAADPVICESKSTILSAVTNAVSVRWSPAIALSDSSVINPVANPVVTTKYYITATTGICRRRDSVTVIVNPAPVANAGLNDTICFGGEGRLHGSGGIIYEWSPSQYLSDNHLSDPLVQQPVTTTYYLEVTDGNGCKSLAKDAVIITVPPPAKLYAGNDTAVAVKQPVQLFAADINNIGFSSYTWSPAKDLNNPFIKNPVAILSDSLTQFIVTASTPANCIGKDTMYVRTYWGPQIYVASSFTPNGDGINDVLKAFPVGIKSFTHFTVYNRYGQRIFTTANANIGWDGTIKGIKQHMSSFVWIAAAVDYHGNVIQRKGTTTIIQ